MIAFKHVLDKFALAHLGRNTNNSLIDPIDDLLLQVSLTNTSNAMYPSRTSNVLG